MEAYSSNGSIALEQVAADNLHTGTSNSEIIGTALISGEISVSNSNGPISLTDIKADVLTASTSNSTNQLQNAVLSRSVSLANSNGSVEILQAESPLPSTFPPLTRNFRRDPRQSARLFY